MNKIHPVQSPTCVECKLRDSRYNVFGLAQISKLWSCLLNELNITPCIGLVNGSYFLLGLPPRWTKVRVATQTAVFWLENVRLMYSFGSRKSLLLHGIRTFVCVFFFPMEQLKAKFKGNDNKFMEVWWHDGLLAQGSKRGLSKGKGHMEPEGCRLMFHTAFGYWSVEHSWFCNCW